ncbi:Phosphatidylglycerophosphate synthase [Halalkaliarchaeum sp. AArc-CO]|uniref:CDP-alcohol phosphatidyltransferase family protein n=1 Tax=unclassified Halalkaliarchaeum TaxID=2678344 RepID=UPI00217D6A65|nr:MULTISPECIES: CDP-alcohol phosphatidyltransferase family protein [unclassified Halalkaliarchaeum]MDR5671734.1 CDP-alcohol phosphatidyltransferase family protein [Halalkaliarchaeum sp. AArc-GB]UWG51229.1 Phosphatidylglycerophosphate synthase [Halalkaliarchaeum sp. AArc-CO]
MNTPTRVAAESAHARLRQHTAAWFLTAGIATGGVGALGAVRSGFGATWLGWAAIALVVLAVEYRLVVVRLPANHRPDAEGLSPNLGAANLLTLLRGILIAWTAGFLAFGGGWLSTVGWFPAVCYGVAALLDAGDGALARHRGRITALGAQLDTEYDALGILVATVVGVFGGAIPAWYLSVGFARYAFVGGVRLRRLRGLPVYELPERTPARLLAGAQMAFLAAALSPILGTDAVAVGVVIVGVPFLLGFLRDWLHVSGRHPGLDQSKMDGR